MQRHAVPFKRQPRQLRFCEDATGGNAVQDRVEQHRMQGESARIGCQPCRQRRFDEDLGAAAPYRLQPAERRTVVVTTFGQSGVDRRDVDRCRILRRPPGQVLLVGAESPDGASDPSALRVHARSAPSSTRE